jgi:hypothetical protein
VKFINTHEPKSKSIDLVGLSGAGHWAAAARAICGGAIDHAAIDSGGFRFGRVLDIRDPNFLPGGAKYGDLPGILALAAPAPMLLFGENDEALAPVRAQYKAANAEKKLSAQTATGDAIRETTIKWLLAEAAK